MSTATVHADLLSYETQNPANLRGRLAVLTSDTAGSCWQATNATGETIHCSTFATAIDTAQETRA